MEWKPIDTAPRDGTRIWAYWPTTNGDAVHSNAAQVETWFGPRGHPDGVAKCWQTAFEWGDDAGPCRPTHWMPLPPPPGEGETP